MSDSEKARIMFREMGVTLSNDACESLSDELKVRLVLRYEQRENDRRIQEGGGNSVSVSVSPSSGDGGVVQCQQSSVSPSVSSVSFSGVSGGRHGRDIPCQSLNQFTHLISLLINLK